MDSVHEKLAKCEERLTRALEEIKSIQDEVAALRAGVEGATGPAAEKAAGATGTVTTINIKCPKDIIVPHGGPGTISVGCGIGSITGSANGVYNFTFS